MRIPGDPVIAHAARARFTEVLACASGSSGLVSCVFLAVATACLAVPAVGSAAERLVAVDEANRLVVFSSDTPRAITRVRVTGLGAGERLLGLDVRPANGQLVAVSSSSRLYALDAGTGAATAIGQAPFSPAVSGGAFGFDFNPTVDRIRLTSDGRQNLRLHPDTGRRGGGRRDARVRHVGCRERLGAAGRGVGLHEQRARRDDDPALRHRRGARRPRSPEPAEQRHARDRRAARRRRAVGRRLRHRTVGRGRLGGAPGSRPGRLAALPDQPGDRRGDARRSRSAAASP